MRSIFSWTAFAYWLLLTGIGSLASVALFVYAFIFGGPWSPFFWAAMLVLTLVGFSQIVFLASCNSTLQMGVPDR
ncbi:MAG: hypothetical protein HYV46_20605, partial [candidate division NC10 bacterium]|nr:hypothetical protein [candidate division NC10 bacterium]